MKGAYGSLCLVQAKMGGTMALSTTAEGLQALLHIRKERTLTTFDEKVFMSLAGAEFSEYCEQISTSGLAGLNAATTISLLKGLVSCSNDLDETRAAYLIMWGIRLKFDGVNELAVRFLEREAQWHGPQLTILRALEGACDLLPSHIERMKIRNCPEVYKNEFDKQISILRRKTLTRKTKPR